MKKLILIAVLFAACSKQETKPVQTARVVTIPAGTYVMQGDSLVQIKQDVSVTILPAGNTHP
jgi:hypothetical protein